MRTLHLLLPGLLWPTDLLQRSLASQSYPALQQMLGYAHLQYEEKDSLENRLLDHYGLSAANASLAAIRRCGESDARSEVSCGAEVSLADASWLCADPVQLYFARDQLLLHDAGNIDVTRDEADRLVADLNRDFGDLGEFIAPHPQRWYLKMPAPVTTRFAALNDVIGRPVALFQPEGEQAVQWARTLNALQIFCHNHPLNQAREATGKPPLNSLWLWGNGASPVRTERTAASTGNVIGDHPIALGLARLNGQSTLDMSQYTAALDASHASLLLVEDALQHSIQYQDPGQWLATLARLEQNVFAPAWHALQAGKIATLRIDAPGDQATLALVLQRPKRWQFWKKSRGAELLSPSAISTSTGASPITRG